MTFIVVLSELLNLMKSIIIILTCSICVVYILIDKLHASN